MKIQARILLSTLVLMISFPAAAEIPPVMRCRDKDDTFATGVDVAFHSDGSVSARFSAPGSAPIRASVIDLVPQNPRDIREIVSFTMAHGLIDTCDVNLKKKTMSCQDMGEKKLSCTTFKGSASE